ncbi:MAG: IPExxxVDY family protein, partial [Crocinitomicaceae bacterium]|nr:IPExxxVDY family protein [Crocinitomicaceae bacterium]
EFFEHTQLIGIIAPIKSYQFIWNINELLGYQFKINHDLEIASIRKKRNYYFSVYEFRSIGSVVTHYLYQNQYDGEYLLPEFKHLDYLWLIKGDEFGADEITALQQSLKMLPMVQLVNQMDTEKIKNKDALVF